MAILVWVPSRVLQQVGLPWTTGTSPLWVRILVSLGHWSRWLWAIFVLVAFLDQAAESALVRWKRSDRRAALMLLCGLVLFGVLSWRGESDSVEARAAIGAFLALLLVGLLILATAVVRLVRFGWRGVAAVVAGLLVAGGGLAYQGRRLVEARETAPGALTIGELRVHELFARGQRRLARVTGSNGAACELGGGEALADGVVKSVDEHGVVVEAALPGSSTEKRLLRFAPPQRLPPIPLASDTTRISGPLLADGTPDYGAWLNAKYGAGATPENNAAAPLSAALGGLVEADRLFWDGIPTQQWSGKVQSRPWSEQECPACARRLALNEKALASVAEAARRPRYFVAGPSGGRIANLPIPSLLRFRVGANALAGRAMLRIGRGDLDGARQDALTVQRLSVLLGQGPSLIDRLIAIGLRGIGVPLLPRLAASSAAAELRAVLDDLHALPELAGVAQCLDEKERLLALDAVLIVRERVSQGRTGSLLAVLEPELPRGLDGPALPPDAYLLPAGSIDWEEALRAVNRHYDLEVAALQARSPEDAKRARDAVALDSGRRQAEAAAVLVRLRATVRSDETRAADIATAAQRLDAAGRKQLAAVWLEWRSLTRAGIAGQEAEAQFRLAAFGLALAAHKLEKGGFPASLAGLSPWLRRNLAPERPSPGYAMRYSRTAAGYALTAAPQEWGETGTRGFCADPAGVMRYATKADALKLVDGACDPLLSPLP